MRGRRGTFATYIEVCGSPATNRDTCGAAAFCVAGVTLSAPEFDLRGRRGTFATYIEVCGSPATTRDTCGAAAFCVAGVTLSAPEVRFAWQAWYFRYLHRGLRKSGDEPGHLWRRGVLRGRRDAFSTGGSICVAGVVLSLPT